jgi:hypothetical protein
MRSLIFARRPPAQRRRARAGSLAPTAMTIDDDMSYQGDTDTRPASPNPRAAHMRARATANKKLDEVATKRKSSLCPFPPHREDCSLLVRNILCGALLFNFRADVSDRPGMNSHVSAVHANFSNLPPKLNWDQTDDAVLQLIRRLNEIRKHSDPKIFAELWAERIERINEDEDDLDIAAEQEGEAAAALAAKDDAGPTSFVNQNLPAMTTFSVRPPQLPAMIFIAITKSPLLPLGITGTAAPNPQAKPFPWSAAPVTATDMHKFIHGVLYRANVDTPDVLG